MDSAALTGCRIRGRHRDSHGDPSPRVFTIPASAPFVPTLIGALRDGTLIEGFPDTGDPLALASATLYLPTRRACRLARDIFLDVTGADAAILPRIVPIGDIDEDELVFADVANASALDLPDELGGLERRLLLAQLVTKWAASQAIRREGSAPLVANNPASALALADALARLMDDMTTRQVPWDKLDTLVPDEHDEYWQLTLRFLNKIAREAWPAILDERGRIEPAARRDLLIAAEAKRLAAHASGPVIAAGSTGSMPATAALIETIAKLPHGAVVLPGLDTDLDDASWDVIAGGATPTARDRRARHRPSAIRHAGAARAHRHRARRGAPLGAPSARRARRRLGSHAARRHHRPLARPRGARAARSTTRSRMSR